MIRMRSGRSAAAAVVTIAMACSIGSATAAPQTPSADALMNWAETAYASLFPSHEATQALNPYVFRFYPKTGNYLGIAGDSVVVLGPVSGNVVLTVGKLADFACLVAPQDCVTPKIARVAAASSFTVLALNDGRVGVLGTEKKPATYSGVLQGTYAKLVKGLSGIVSVHTPAGGEPRTYALTSNGTAFGWGSNRLALGQPRGTGTDVVTDAVQISQFQNVVEIGSTAFNSYALQSDGSVWVLPGIVYDDGRVEAIKVPDVPPIVATSETESGNSFVALDNTGSLWVVTASSTSVRDAANKRKLYPASAERMLFAPDNVAKVSCKQIPPEGHCIVQKTDGSLWAWGKNLNGTLGDGTNVDKTAPVKVKMPAGVVVSKISARGGSCSMALATTGKLYFWGTSGGCGGTGNIYDKAVDYWWTPKLTPNISGVTDFFPDSHNMVVIRSDGSLWSWGWNDDGQFGTGTSFAPGFVDDIIPYRAVGISIK